MKKINEITEIFDLISESIKNSTTRSVLTIARTVQLESLINSKNDNEQIKKVAFDTRRINEETQYNPRRGLQNYHRSEPFVSTSTAQKLASFNKLRKSVKLLENKFGKEPEWGDSYARVLLSTLDKGLRINEKDGDFSAEQPSVGSLDYIGQLLHLRYRLTTEDLDKFSEEELRERILSRDEELINKQAYLGLSDDVVGVIKNTDKKNEEVFIMGREINDTPIIRNTDDSYISRREVMVKDYDSLMDKLFGNVKASKENPEIERAVTITIKEKLGS
jgi:hypothetical protein